MLNWIIRFIYVTYLHVIYFMHKLFGIKMYGLGWTASKVTEPFVFYFKGIRFYFSPPASRSYCLLPAGIPNEPETHHFLDRILAAKTEVTFVDVGASIGEFAIPMAYDSRVEKVIAFEPHPMSHEGLFLSITPAIKQKIELIQKGASAKSGFASFDLRSHAPTSAKIDNISANQHQHNIEISTLDQELKIDAGKSVILLIDIEGGELDALRGGIKFISDHSPLIIFEYNKTSKLYFNLSQIEDLIGMNYQFYRLRSGDGLLDDNLNETWNIVALPKKGPWQYLKDVDSLFYEKL